MMSRGERDGKIEKEKMQMRADSLESYMNQL